MQHCRALTPDCSSVSLPVWVFIGHLGQSWLVIGQVGEVSADYMTAVRQPDWRPTLVQDMQQTTVQSVNISLWNQSKLQSLHLISVWKSNASIEILVLTEKMRTLSGNNEQNDFSEMDNEYLFLHPSGSGPAQVLHSADPRSWGRSSLTDTKVICLIVPHLSPIYCGQIECSKENRKLQPKVSPANLFSRVRYNSYLYNSRAVHWTEVAFCLFPW